MSASSRVCPQERAVWRFDARGGYLGRVWDSGWKQALFRATFLSLNSMHTEWTKRSLGQNVHSAGKSTEWSKWAHGQAGHDFLDKDNRGSKRHFVALIQSIHKNGSTPQNEALKCTVFYKASPHNEDLALVVLKIKASKWGLDLSGSCPHFEGMKFGEL